MATPPSQTTFTVIYSDSFEQDAETQLTDDELEALETLLAINPFAGTADPDIPNLFGLQWHGGALAIYYRYDPGTPDVIELIAMATERERRTPKAGALDAAIDAGKRIAVGVIGKALWDFIKEHF